MLTNIELGKLECEGGAHAEGIARAEYSIVSLWEDTADCSRQGAGNTIGGTAGSSWWLIQKVNGQTSVNTVTVLATNSYPRGGQSLFDKN